MIEAYPQYGPHNTISLSSWVHLISKSPKDFPYRVFLVCGKLMYRERIFSAIERHLEFIRNALLFRIDEDIIRLESEFYAHLIKIIGQEVNQYKNINEGIKKPLRKYLLPFDVLEETRKLGFEWHFLTSKEQKLTKKVIYEEEIKKDLLCCIEMMQRERYKLFSILNSIDKTSEAVENFVVKFLQWHYTFLILGGTNELSFNRFLSNLGIIKYLKPVYLILNETKDELSGEEILTSNVSAIVDAIINAFSIESRRFNYLRFKIYAHSPGQELPTTEFIFDACIMGHLMMREDYPKLIRTNYDCAVLIKILSEPIVSSDILYAAASAAYDLLLTGIELKTGEYFEPWDTYIFLIAPSFSDEVVHSYKHQGYRNIFIILKDGSFHNTSPHSWMNIILNNIARSIAKMNLNSQAQRLEL